MPAVLVILIVLLLTVGIVKPVLWVAAAVLLFVYIQYGRQSGRGRTSNEEYRAYRDRRDAQVVDFLTAAPGVTTIDSTELDFGQTVQAVVDLVHTTTSLH